MGFEHVAPWFVSEQKMTVAAMCQCRQDRVLQFGFELDGTALGTHGITGGLSAASLSLSLSAA